MSQASETADISLLLADYASTDSDGKLNVIGGTVSVLGFQPGQGVTARFSVVVTTRLPYASLPADVSFEIALLEAGELVQLPGLNGPESLRVSQNIEITRPAQAFSTVVREHIGSIHTTVLDFSNGLPLRAGGTYEWRVRIDGSEEREWRLPFAVIGPPDRPVIG